MCGIAGLFSLEGNFNREMFSAANNIVEYRGPDDFGYVSFDQELIATEHVDEWLMDLDKPEKVFGALGFRRLAIIDLSSSGHQPMADEDRRYWIVFNGEVYNYLEIRLELEKLGYEFRSNSDTEVVLCAYREWGPQCQDRFNGMWAMAIFDRSKRELFCSRDRFGIKPFYYYRDDRDILFGSEVKQILKMMNVKPRVDSAMVFDFLAYGARNHTHHTFHEGIKELRGGECMTVTFGDCHVITVKTDRWWDVQVSPYVGSEQNAIDEFLELLSDSVVLRLRSDVPTGTALSGGLDSNGLVALIHELNSGKDQHVFTVYSDDRDTDELQHANETIEKFGLISHTLKFGTHDIDILERITFHRDQPLDNAGALGGWLLQSLVRDSGIVVNLSGQGADELTGGYSSPPHVGHYLEYIRQGRFIHAHKSLYDGFRNSSMPVAATSIRFGLELGRNLSRKAVYRALLKKHKSYLKNEFTDSHVRHSALLRCAYENSMAGKFSLTKACAYRELKFTHLPYMLQNLDRDSMAHSLEARVPFLDYRVAEFLMNLPDTMLLKNGYTKHILRRAISGKVSDSIVWNKRKKGFATPKDKYLTSGSDYINDLLHQNINHAVLNVNALLTGLNNPKAATNRILWRSICYLIWERQLVNS